MIYSYEKLSELVADNKIVVGAEPNQIQAASIDVTLGKSFKVPVSKKPILKLGKDVPEYIDVTNKVIINPHSFILATTKEKIVIPSNMGAWIEGKSSIGRSGLFIQNAGWIAPGFEGEITLELYNANNYGIEIEQGISIGQIIVSDLDTTTLKPYAGKYNNQTGATAPIDDKDKAVYDVPVQFKVFPTNKVISSGSVYSGFKDSLIAKDEVAEFNTYIFNVDEDRYTIHLGNEAIDALKNNFEELSITNPKFIEKLKESYPNCEEEREFKIFGDIGLRGKGSSTSFRCSLTLQRKPMTDTYVVVDFNDIKTGSNAIWGGIKKR